MSLGLHLLLDVAGAPFATLDDPVLVETLLVDAVRAMGAKVLGSDPGSGIDHRNPSLAGVAIELYPDGPACGGVLHGIVEEIEEHLPQTQPVAPDAHRLVPLKNERHPLIV